MSYNFSNARQLLDQLFGTVLFMGETPSDEPTIPHHRVDGKTQLIVVVGDNASGKSMMRRVVQGLCKQAKIECIHLSMEGRGSSTYNPFRSFVYGDESMQATGVNSINTVLIGIKTCRDRDKPHVIFWDEPDLGLSDGWAAGMGQTIADFAKDLPKLTKAVVLITHSKALVGQLLDLNPNYVHLGVPSEKAPQSLMDWFEAPIIPRNPEELGDLSHKRFRAIQKTLNEKK